MNSRYSLQSWTDHETMGPWTKTCKSLASCCGRFASLCGCFVSLCCVVVLHLFVAVLIVFSTSMLSHFTQRFGPGLPPVGFGNPSMILTNYPSPPDSGRGSRRGTIKI